MSHTRNDSSQSAASSETSETSVSSTSSQASVELYNDQIRPLIADISQGSTLENLVAQAKKIIEEFTPNPRSTYKYKKDNKDVCVQLDAVMSAMLECADECGGEKGQCYVASAIVACSAQGDAAQVDALSALGTTWLTHLLFIFKTSRSHSSQPNKRPSQVATPTVDETAGHLLNSVGPRQESFRDNVIKRDGYECVLTGTQDINHPRKTPRVFKAQLQCAHILRRAIGEFNDKDHNSPSFRSASTTFDILVNFTRLPLESLEALRAKLDDPSNGMMLEKNAHDAYDQFNWCMKQTEEENVYKVNVFNEEGIMELPEDGRIVFEDRSHNFGSERSVALPNPLFIEIHAAIAGIMNMSGAGKFFDELLDKDKDDKGDVAPVRSWEELEAYTRFNMFRESVAATITVR